MSRFLEVAKTNFHNREYKKALLNFSLALKDEPHDLDAKIGALLCDMAFEKEDEAVALFELYEGLRSESVESAVDFVEKLLASEVDVLDMDEDDSIENQMNYDDGIEYRDFLELVHSRQDFQRALEDLMFSTRIIIHKKEDFIEFVNLLIENNYSNIALNYLESALSLYPHETFFQETLNKLES